MSVSFARSNIETNPALVLNADFRPLSYFPLSLWHWQTALKAVFLERVTIISQYDKVVHSPSFEMNLPSVIALKDYIKPVTYPAFTRFNLFLRDGFACQYCGSKSELTFDHLIPRCLGGGTSWDNITTACTRCNKRKGGQTPKGAHMYPRINPYRPTSHDLQKKGQSFPPNYFHDSWMDYLYWDVELER